LSAVLVSFLSPDLGFAAVFGLSFLGTAFLAVFGAAGSIAAFLAAGADLGVSAAFFFVETSFLGFSVSFLDLLSALPPVDFLGAGPGFSVSVDGRLVPLSALLPCLESVFFEASALGLDSSFFLSAGFLSVVDGVAFLSTGFFSTGAFLSAAAFFSGADFFSGACFFSAAADFLSADFFSTGFLVSSKGAGAGCFFSGFFSDVAAAGFFSVPDGFFSLPDGFFSLPDGFLSPPPLPDAAGLAKIINTMYYMLKLFYYIYIFSNG